MSDAALRSALRRIGSDAPVRFDEVTGSTQATALELAEAGAPQWTLVASAHQTRGRGRLDRSWLDEPGALLFSVVVRPELPADRGGLVTLLAGVAMADSLRATIDSRVVCKWPNDLLVGDAKVGGILAGARSRGEALVYVVLGVGVNLGAAPDVPGAGALAGADAAEVLGMFLEGLARDLVPDRPAFAEEVVERYRAVCATLGRRVRATTTGGRVVEGDAVGVDQVGRLIVRTEDGPTVVGFGEIEHLRDDALPGDGTPG
ncbi:MAG TPA: biotin--[acetyl-CoA-carboxylase] ligase [Actinomycetota bacterium]|nr:biotin--[acetyl-CoA-carboxylase] ligase [Actinomycetota bacterium]